MMSNGKNPLMLMMALTMPGAVNALGLGDIHVDSALNERLAAEIDIVGATPLELTDIRAAVANRETFLRYGADRPSFLSSATFKVTQDAQGRPVLSVRSTEAFTEQRTRPPIHTAPRSYRVRLRKCGRPGGAGRRDPRTHRAHRAHRARCAGECSCGDSARGNKNTNAR
jgi:hypothetical protein